MYALLMDFSPYLNIVLVLFKGVRNWFNREYIFFQLTMYSLYIVKGSSLHGLIVTL